METLIPGIYRHFKGNRYRVWGVVRHSETQEKMVLYQALYGEYGLWVRPLSMFLEEVERDGRKMPRFSYEGPAEEADGADLLTALAKKTM